MRMCVDVCVRYHTSIQLCMHVLRGCPPGAQRVPHKVVQRFGPQNVHALSFLRWGNRCVRGCARVQVYIWCLVMSRYATTILAPRRVYMRLAVCLFVCGMYVEFDLVATARVSGSGKSSGSGS